LARKDLQPTVCRPIADQTDFCAMNRPPDITNQPGPVDLASESDFVLGQFRIRPSLCEIEAGGQTQTVEPRVMQVLAVLARAQGAVVSRDELIRRCWGGRAISEDAINRCIAKVRKLAEQDSGASFEVETIPRVGYRLLEKRVAPDGHAQSPSMDSEARAAETHPALPPTSKPRATGRFVVPTFGAVAIAGFAFAGVIFFERNAERIPNAQPVQLASVIQPPSVPAGGTFQDCADSCPEMVVIPPGKFLMGSRANEPLHRADEGPQHQVTIAYWFAVSRFDVTRAEYARFASETGRPPGESCSTLLPSGRFIETPGAGWANPGFNQTSQDPVVCMNWDDASAYADWLSRKTAKPYRLLSEAEWEYAARAGNAATHGSAQPEVLPCGKLNSGDADYHAQYPGDPVFDPSCHDGYAHTSPVGRFPANAFGLYDMEGNVGQWTADCYNQTYDGAPDDGSAWQSANCSLRVSRGGAWTDDSRHLRIALRTFGAPAARFNANGFRIARAM
jgi:formylglycine-generating enzyme